MCKYVWSVDLKIHGLFHKVSFQKKFFKIADIWLYGRLDILNNPLAENNTG